jgi:ERCC4-type nuclease
MLQASPDEHKSKLGRVRDLMGEKLQVARKPLQADYIFVAHGKVVAIEVKWSVSDLLGSLTPGDGNSPRLAGQVRRMLSFADIPILIIPSLHERGDGKVEMEEWGKKTRTSGWQYLSVKGILADIALYGCIVDEWAGDIARRLAQWYYTLTAEEHEWVRQRGRPEFITLDHAYRTAVWALAAFEGVGPVGAEALLETFGSVAGVAGQSVKDLQKVKGIGPRTAESLFGGLHEEWT